MHFKYFFCFPYNLLGRIFVVEHSFLNFDKKCLSFDIRPWLLVFNTCFLLNKKMSLRTVLLLPKVLFLSLGLSVKTFIYIGLKIDITFEILGMFVQIPYGLQTFFFSFGSTNLLRISLKIERSELSRHESARSTRAQHV